MALRYRIEVLAWAAVLFLLGAITVRAWMEHDEPTAFLAACAALATMVCLLEVTLREAIADGVCRALTGDPMPPRAPR